MASLSYLLVDDTQIYQRLVREHLNSYLNNPDRAKEETLRRRKIDHLQVDIVF